MFKIKSYGKSELALIYFPKSSCPEVALNHLRSWIKGCPELVAELSKLRRRKHLKEYSRREVALIVEYLDEPNGPSD